MIDWSEHQHQTDGRLVPMLRKFLCWMSSSERTITLL